MRAALALLLLCLPVQAHDTGPGSWINHGAFRSPVTNEFCCGESDCAVVRAQHVTLPTLGYRVSGSQFVPESEALPSQDGQAWLCKRADGSRRCFFAPIEGF